MNVFEPFLGQIISTVNVVKYQEDPTTKILDSLKPGDFVKVYLEVEFAKEDIWYYVKTARDKIGWVPKNSVKYGSHFLLPYGIVINAHTVNVRKNPAKSSPRITTLGFGAKFRINSEQNDWYKIETYDNEKGWVPKKYIANINWNIPEPHGMVVNTEALTVRKGPGTTYDKVSWLNYLDVVTLLDMGGCENETTCNWYKISIPNSTTIGWVSQNYIRFIWSF